MLRVIAKALVVVELLMMFQFIIHLLVNQNTANLDCQPPLRSPVTDASLQRPGKGGTQFRRLLVVTQLRKLSKLYLETLVKR
ncbi:MAG: hypothetical protein Ct9H90mP7_2530 [Candidatus Neomarinimicrobiota bacterium]|nr:MAG: hypothetical protein Ct9H90mP7_2530 [Candidatus Neomarinimicrobiota bacterium]